MINLTVKKVGELMYFYDNNGKEIGWVKEVGSVAHIGGMDYTNTKSYAKEFHDAICSKLKSMGYSEGTTAFNDFKKFVS